eukprot:scaffold614028_cov20-Prasinocladus_malaysianus.AAC.1
MQGLGTLPGVVRVPRYHHSQAGSEYEYRIDQSPLVIALPYEDEDEYEYSNLRREDVLIRHLLACFALENFCRGCGKRH